METFSIPVLPTRTWLRRAHVPWPSGIQKIIIMKGKSREPGIVFSPFTNIAATIMNEWDSLSYYYQHSPIPTIYIHFPYILSTHLLIRSLRAIAPPIRVPVPAPSLPPSRRVLVVRAIKNATKVCLEATYFDE